MRYLCLQRGGSLGDGIRRMLHKIGENSLWAEYSYKGRKGKRPFQKLLINDVIIRKRQIFTRDNLSVSKVTKSALEDDNLFDYICILLFTIQVFSVFKYSELQ